MSRIEDVLPRRCPFCMKKKRKDTMVCDKCFEKAIYDRTSKFGKSVINYINKVEEE